MISLIICTQNPSETSLRMVFESLKEQTLDLLSWELLVVDNGSAVPVTGRFDLAWHPNHRIIVEHKPGLLAARLAAINQASGEIFVFVDDDNLLDPGYLQEAVRIGTEFPMLGIWGGSSIGVYEETPPDWIRRREYHLSVRLITATLVTDSRDLSPPWIIGAGMVARKEVALRYASMMKSDSRRASLGRNGGRLIGGEDLDMSLTACDLGYYRGVFPSLSLRHLIPKNRTEPQRFLSLVEGNSFSTTYLEIIRNGLPSSRRSRLLTALPRLLSDLLLDHDERLYQLALRRGRKAAMAQASGEMAERPSSLIGHKPDQRM